MKFLNNKMSDIKKFLTDYLKKKTNLSGEELLYADYLKDGLIDSLQFIMMVNDLEKKFDITFSSSELQSDDFRKIDGLAEIINRLREKNNTR